MAFDVKENAPLARFTTYGVGGPAERLFTPHGTVELRDFMRRNRPEKFTVIGGGSNVLIRDGGIRGLVIRLEFSGIEIQGRAIVCDGFVANSRLCGFAAEHGIAGFEFLASLPGTVAGGIPTNAGAGFGRPGGNLSDRVADVTVIDSRGEERVIYDLHFSYRHGEIPPNAVVVQVRLEGTPGKPDEIKAAVEENRRKKKATQPIGERCAGSVFKTQPDGTPAWKLIVAAGLQGLERNGALVSPVHANFIVNTGTATAAAIEELAEIVRAKVSETSGRTLEYEIKILGDRT